MSKILVIVFYPIVWVWAAFVQVYSWVFYGHSNWLFFNNFDRWIIGTLLLPPTVFLWIVLVTGLLEITQPNRKER